MKHSILRIFALLFLFTVLHADEFLPQGYTLGQGGVVLELFTSEGCSSCPPVDKALQKLVEEAETKQIPIHLVSWHVDYWDKLRTHHGVWKDPYSAKVHTHRQRVYSLKFVELGHAPKPILVTPQYLLNGRLRKSFTEKKLMDQFKEASAMIEDGLVTGTLQATEDTFTVSWKLDQSVSTEDHYLTVVLTESDLTSKITGGENFGKTLVHHHVVRDSDTFKPENAQGTVALSIPSDWKGKKAAVMILLQNKDFQIVDYHRLPIQDTPKPEKMTSLEQLLHNNPVCTPDGCTNPDGKAVTAEAQSDDHL